MQANRLTPGKLAVMFALVAAFQFASRGAEDFTRNFDDANRLYDEAKYSEAGNLYKPIVDAGHYSPELFYNLGNTEFRLDKTGPAILNYERASYLSPGNPEIAANLAYARAQTGARIAEKDWRDDIVMNFSIDSYCWLAAISAWIAIFAAAALLLKVRLSRAPLALAAVCGVAILSYATFAIYHLQMNDALAIVTAKSVEARFAPADDSTLAATLPAGSRVWILETRGPWMHCKLPDHLDAWVPSGSIERVRLQNS